MSDLRTILASINEVKENTENDIEYKLANVLTDAITDLFNTICPKSNELNIK